MNSPFWTDSEQFECLVFLEYITDLFAASGQRSFTPAQVVSVLRLIGKDPELFDPLVCFAFAQATAAAREQTIQRPSSDTPH